MGPGCPGGGGDAGGGAHTAAETARRLAHDRLLLADERIARRAARGEQQAREAGGRSHQALRGEPLRHPVEHAPRLSPRAARRGAARGAGARLRVHEGHHSITNRYARLFVYLLFQEEPVSIARLAASFFCSKTRVAQLPGERDGRALPPRELPRDALHRGGGRLPHGKGRGGGALLAPCCRRALSRQALRPPYRGPVAPRCERVGALRACGASSHAERAATPGRTPASEAPGRRRGLPGRVSVSWRRCCSSITRPVATSFFRAFPSTLAKAKRSDPRAAACVARPASSRHRCF